MEQFILEVMKLVELDSLSNALVGRPGVSGLSVEQRKRLTIAVELVANPSIVFMDEPTSGTDLKAWRYLQAGKCFIWRLQEIPHTLSGDAPCNSEQNTR